MVDDRIFERNKKLILVGEVGDHLSHESATYIHGNENRIFNTVLRQGKSFDLENLARLLSRASVVVGPDTA